MKNRGSGRTEAIHLAGRKSAGKKEAGEAFSADYGFMQVPPGASGDLFSQEQCALGIRRDLAYADGTVPEDGPRGRQALAPTAPSVDTDVDGEMLGPQAVRLLLEKRGGDVPARASGVR